MTTTEQTPQTIFVLIQDTLSNAIPPKMLGAHFSLEQAMTAADKVIPAEGSWANEWEDRKGIYSRLASWKDSGYGIDALVWYRIQSVPLFT
jgi:hypothetical protein